MADNSLKKGRYTKYSNKIGLYSNSKGGFIKNDTSVVLSFPFKDTVLEAGMSKEEIGREERFLHREIDSKDIDTLEELKVLTHFRYLDKDGKKALTASSDIEFFDAEGRLKQNLLIKGNNLLALCTLRERLAGQVKLIYIDPPYNTGNDGFKYNDRFNHSAWLTFMKNRLEVAKELLRDNGVIFVSCDDNEQGYLRVLMDEIFSSDNFIGQIIWSRKRGKDNSARFLSRNHEYLIVFAKDITSAEFNRLELDERIKKAYKNPDNDPRGVYRILGVWARGTQGGSQYEFTTKTGQIFSERLWLMNKASMTHMDEQDKLIYSEDSDKIYRKFFLADNIGSIPETIWNDTSNAANAADEIKALFNSQVFETVKPEGLMRRVVGIATNEGDIVLDFCLGSGTTAAVAHKMNRRWIGIEQMDYIEDIAKERLKKVVAGEQGGISKSVSWNGGGSFVCFELKKYNQYFIDKINAANNMGELDKVYSEMAKNAFLKFWFDKKHFEKDENFRNLSLEERKQKLIEILDENHLYLNYADMNDMRHQVTADEKALTDRFYGATEN